MTRGIASGPKWRNWQTRWTQTPVRLTPRAGSTPAFGTIVFFAPQSDGFPTPHGLRHPGEVLRAPHGCRKESFGISRINRPGIIPTARAHLLDTQNHAVCV